MRFAHFADIHIGSWRDEKLKGCAMEAFHKAVDLCIDKEVDFVLIAGDLFNTALPNIDQLKDAVGELKRIKEHGIRTYVIAGSHDFSPSGKTMINVLEKAGLVMNVTKGQIIDDKLRLNFVIDKQTGAKITGIVGMKGMLDKKYYEVLDRESLELEEGYKIFIFHTALEEFKPKGFERMEASPLSLLPKGFNYYAGGHVHYIFKKEEEGYGVITYPGALFPANFREMEEYNYGGLYLIENNNIEWKPIKLYDVKSIKINCEGKSASEINHLLKKQIEEENIEKSIVTIRLFGKMREGRVTDISFKDIFEICYSKNAFHVMKNTTKLTTPEFEEIMIKSDNTEDIEAQIIKENLGQIPMDNEEENVNVLMKALDIERADGEKVAEFEYRIIENAENFVRILNCVTEKQDSIQKNL